MNCNISRLLAVESVLLPIRRDGNIRNTLQKKREIYLEINGKKMKCCICEKKVVTLQTFCMV
jgi:hypothetical protein